MIEGFFLRCSFAAAYVVCPKREAKQRSHEEGTAININEYIKQLQDNRSFMKSAFAEDLYESDQEKKVAQPPLTKAATSDRIISLTRE